MRGVEGVLQLHVSQTDENKNCSPFLQKNSCDFFHARTELIAKISHLHRINAVPC